MSTLSRNEHTRTELGPPADAPVFKLGDALILFWYSAAVISLIAMVFVQVDTFGSIPTSYRLAVLLAGLFGSGISLTIAKGLACLMRMSGEDVD